MMLDGTVNGVSSIPKKGDTRIRGGPCFRLHNARHLGR
jgi:hypothetical protein